MFADKRNTSGYNVHLAYHPSCSSQTCAWGKKQRTRRPSTCQRSRAVQGRKTPPLNWVPLNQDDPAVRNKCFGLHSEPHSRKRTSQMQTASTAAPTSYIDLYRQGMPSCTLFHYTVYNHYLYSHYTTTIQPEEVMSEAWGSTWEPQRSGAVRATSGSTPNVLYKGAGWFDGEFPGAPTVRIGQDSVPRL